MTSAGTASAVAAITAARKSPMRLALPVLCPFQAFLAGWPLDFQ
ncbi:hypothetical protein [uncultured Paracoccus sp.]|nr:hypothetical protein [uncultured Paracoccus sp.]